MSAITHNWSYFTKLKQTFWSILGYPACPLKGTLSRCWGSANFHRETMELLWLCLVIPTSFPCDKRYLYPKQVVWNKLIMWSQEDESIKEVREIYFNFMVWCKRGYLSINLSLAVWFCLSCFYRKKGHVGESQSAQLVRESDSFVLKPAGNKKCIDQYCGGTCQKPHEKCMNEVTLSLCLNMLVSRIVWFYREAL